MSTLIHPPPRPHAKGLLRVVSVNEMVVSADPRDVLVTTALGSAIGLALYDWVERIGGVIHCMLPQAKVDRARAEQNLAMFVDTGVEALLAEMTASGARLKNLVTTVVGAGSSLGADRTIRIAERNITVLRKLLWRNKLLIQRADVGGTRTRSLALYLEDGHVVVQSTEGEIPL